MQKTVLITGTSSGIGKATAVLFAKNGWNVIATMRTPEKETALQNFPNISVQKLDVTDKDSIELAIKNGIRKFGKIDVLVNNAGYGLVGAFELATDEQVGKQFGTNLGGVLACIRGILPHFRQNKNGIIINITSMGGRITFPFYALYNGTKWAVDGFSEALSFELKEFGIKVKIVEPGVVKTEFYGSSPEFTANSKDSQSQIYQKTFAKVQTQYLRNLQNGSTSEQIAKVIWQAANDNSNKLRYKAGKDAIILLFLRKILPERVFIWVIGKVFGV
jgi:NAD(P)-dependent dehydrogenase (short-subunit alcohol dehydrogenase family)